MFSGCISKDEHCVLLRIGDAPFALPTASLTMAGCLLHLQHIADSPRAIAPWLSNKPLAIMPPFDLRYLFFMLLAIVVGTLLLRRSQSKLPLTWQQKWGLGMGAFCGAMIGAKLPFVLVDAEGFRTGTAWFADGKTIMTGLVGAYLGVEVAKWALEIRTKTGDSFASPVAMMVGIGRIACFFGGCCFGQPTSLPWGTVFVRAGDSLPRHPTQLYEAAFHFLAAGVLYELRRREMLRGQLAKVYILSYLFYRFVTEWIRPEPLLLWQLTIYQWSAVICAPIFIGLWVYDARAFARDAK